MSKYKYNKKLPPYTSLILEDDFEEDEVNKSIKEFSKLFDQKKYSVNLNILGQHVFLSIKSNTEDFDLRINCQACYPKREGAFLYYVCVTLDDKTNNIYHLKRGNTISDEGFFKFDLEAEIKELKRILLENKRINLV